MCMRLQCTCSRFMLPSIAWFVRSAISAPFPIYSPSKSRESFSRIVPACTSQRVNCDILTTSLLTGCDPPLVQAWAESMYCGAWWSTANVQTRTVDIKANSLRIAPNL